MQIRINNINEAVEIQKIASEYTEDINIYSGNAWFDPKSLLSMINLCGMPNLYIKMLAFNLDHEKEFNKRMKKYEWSEENSATR